MAESISVSAQDGHQLSAWHAMPNRKPKGGIIFLQAIYGLTTHLGDVCDWYSQAGYAAIAPATYDRTERGKVFGYDASGAAEGMAFRENLKEQTVLLDVKACQKKLSEQSKHIAIAGFCTGGTWAWISASKLEFDAAVIFYGSDVHDHLNLHPKCPTLFHYGDDDHVVPLNRVDQIRTNYPKEEFHIYAGAGHAFYNPEQANHHADAAQLAHQRSINFLDRHFV